MFPTAKNPRVERVWRRLVRREDGTEEFIPCSLEEATNTMMCVTAPHTACGGEYGLAITVTEVIEELDAIWMEHVTKDMQKYVTDNPTKFTEQEATDG